jgi:hypothetical protein
MGTKDGDGSVLTRAEHAAGIAGYVLDGERRAIEIGNRGPVRFDGNGRLHPDIVDAFGEHGFYVFEGVIGPGEIDELRAGADDMIERAPVRRGADVDAQGRPALGRDCAIEPYLLIKPLSDPWGGTEALAGRHPTKMTEARPDENTPDEVL